MGTGSEIRPCDRPPHIKDSTGDVINRIQRAPSARIGGRTGAQIVPS